MSARFVVLAMVGVVIGCKESTPVATPPAGSNVVVAVDARPAATPVDAAPSVAAIDAAVASDAGAAVTLDAAAARTLAARLDACSKNEMNVGAPSPLAPVGDIQRIEPIGNRPRDTAMHLIGTRARAYAFIEPDKTCVVVPVAGKPAAYLHGTFGGGGTVAYVLRVPACNKFGCQTVLSVMRADDSLVDAMPVPSECFVSAELAKLALRSGHDSMKLGCWRASGADPDRTDYVFDADGGALAVLAEVDAGIAWYQVGGDDDQYPPCQARPSGGIAVVTQGAAPVIDVNKPASEAEATAANLDSGGGCAATIATQRQTLDAAKRRFIPVGKPRFSRIEKLCKCPPKQKRPY